MDAPGHLDGSARAVWDEVIAANPSAKLAPFELEAYAHQVALLRDAHQRVRDEGAVVADEKGRPCPHPALAIARAAQDEVRRWGRRFTPDQPVRRRPGAMYDATRRSVAAAEHLRDKPEFEGAIEAACTLAWLIDEAQRAGIDELQKAAFGTIPSYLKACVELQITPASVPETKTTTTKRRGKLAAVHAMAGGGVGASGA